MAQEAKVVLVTGSSSGIGESTAKLFSKNGYKVVVVGSKEDKVKRVAQECQELSPNKLEPLSLILDFSDANNGKVAVQKTVEHFGRLDVLVNNAGIFTKTAGDDPNTYDVYRQVMTINTDATVQASLASIEELKKNKGQMIFVSSVASVKPSERGYAYCMSKAAMSIFAKCLAVDLAPDVRVNIVSPGPVCTPIFERVGLKMDVVPALMNGTTLLNRVGNPDEIASTIAFLVSEGGNFINGHEMFIDGGYLLKTSPNAVSAQVIAAMKNK